MRKLVVLVVLAVMSCATPVQNQALLADGQLIVGGLQMLTPLVPPGEQAIVNGALATISTELGRLQKGQASSITFATVARDALDALVPLLLADTKLSVPASTGLKVLQGLADVLLAEIGPTTPTAASGVAVQRSRVQLWMRTRT